jgi:hypothetical protein
MTTPEHRDENYSRAHYRTNTVTIACRLRKMPDVSPAPDRGLLHRIADAVLRGIGRPPIGEPWEKRWD